MNTTLPSEAPVNYNMTYAMSCCSVWEVISLNIKTVIQDQHQSQDCGATRQPKAFCCYEIISSINMPFRININSTFTHIMSTV